MSRQRITVEDVGDVAVVQFVDKKILDEQNIQQVAVKLVGDDDWMVRHNLARWFEKQTNLPKEILEQLCKDPDLDIGSLARAIRLLQNGADDDLPSLLKEFPKNK